jgi:hypothetical protein
MVSASAIATLAALISSGWAIIGAGRALGVINETSSNSTGALGLLWTSSNGLKTSSKAKKLVALGINAVDPSLAAPMPSTMLSLSLSAPDSSVSGGVGLPICDIVRVFTESRFILPEADRDRRLGFSSPDSSVSSLESWSEEVDRRFSACSLSATSKSPALALSLVMGMISNLLISTLLRSELISDAVTVVEGEPWE